MNFRTTTINQVSNPLCFASGHDFSRAEQDRIDKGF